MSHRLMPSHTTIRRSFTTLAAAASLALFIALGAGCLEDDEGTTSGDVNVQVDCAGLKEWAQNTTYPSGTEVTDTGDAFAARVSHTAFGADWNPKRAASLWLAIGHCKGAAGGGGATPPAPPAGGGGGTATPPAPPAGGGGAGSGAGSGGGGGGGGMCLANGRPGPLFDPAGAKNVGNGHQAQFIGGQCLSAADCQSGCCALPCGICSGPGAQFQNGKQGCGFPR